MKEVALLKYRGIMEASNNEINGELLEARV
jgi:hypothetical protein